MEGTFRVYPWPAAYPAHDPLPREEWATAPPPPPVVLAEEAYFAASEPKGPTVERLSPGGHIVLRAGEISARPTWQPDPRVLWGQHGFGATSAAEHEDCVVEGYAQITSLYARLRDLSSGGDGRAVRLHFNANANPVTLDVSVVSGVDLAAGQHGTPHTTGGYSIASFNLSANLPGWSSSSEANRVARLICRGWDVAAEVSLDGGQTWTEVIRRSLSLFRISRPGHCLWTSHVTEKAFGFRRLSFQSLEPRVYRSKSGGTAEHPGGYYDLREFGMYAHPEMRGTVRAEALDRVELAGPSYVVAGDPIVIGTDGGPGGGERGYRGGVGGDWPALAVATAADLPQHGTPEQRPTGSFAHVADGPRRSLYGPPQGRVYVTWNDSRDWSPHNPFNQAYTKPLAHRSVVAAVEPGAAPGGGDVLVLQTPCLAPTSGAELAYDCAEAPLWGLMSAGRDWGIPPESATGRDGAQPAYMDLPAGRYVMSRRHEILAGWTRWVGAGRWATILRTLPGCHMFSFYPRRRGCSVEDIGIENSLRHHGGDSASFLGRAVMLNANDGYARCIRVADGSDGVNIGGFNSRSVIEECEYALEGHLQYHQWSFAASDGWDNTIRDVALRARFGQASFEIFGEDRSRIIRASGWNGFAANNGSNRWLFADWHLAFGPSQTPHPLGLNTPTHPAYGNRHHNPFLTVGDNPPVRLTAGESGRGYITGVFANLSPWDEGGNYGTGLNSWPPDKYRGHGVRDWLYWLPRPGIGKSALDFNGPTTAMDGDLGAYVTRVRTRGSAGTGYPGGDLGFPRDVPAVLTDVVANRITDKPQVVISGRKTYPEWLADSLAATGAAVIDEVGLPVVDFEISPIKGPRAYRFSAYRFEGADLDDQWEVPPSGSGTSHNMAPRPSVEGPYRGEPLCRSLLVSAGGPEAQIVAYWWEIRAAPEGLAEGDVLHYDYGRWFTWLFPAPGRYAVRLTVADELHEIASDGTILRDRRASRTHYVTVPT